MRPIRLLPLATVLALALVPLAGSSGATTRHACRNVYYAPMYKTITKVSVENSGCRTARLVVLAYERAITSSYSPTSGTTRTGVCFPQHTFGECTLTANGRKYVCDRPEASGRTLPATCTRRYVKVRFKG